MKRGPVSYRRPKRSQARTERIREIEHAFHVREFGEELARINFELTIEQRHEYLAWMRESSRKKEPEPAGKEVLRGKVRKDREIAGSEAPGEEGRCTLPAD